MNLEFSYKVADVADDGTMTMGTGAEAAKFDMKMVLEQKIRVELLD